MEYEKVKDVTIMKCLILAAGYATRLYPLTKNFPKPLLKAGGKTIMDRLVDDVSPAIDEFIVVSNHKFALHFKDWAAGKLQIIKIIDDGTSTNETRLGAVRDIMLGLKDNKDDVLVMAGDNVLDFSLLTFLDFFKMKNASCVMTHEESDLKKQQKTAIITFDENKRIDSYEEKPKKPKGNHAVPPFYCYKAKDVNQIGKALEDGCNADAPGSFAAWLSYHVPMYAFEMPGKRYDIGDIKSYEYVQKVFQVKE